MDEGLLTFYLHTAYQVLQDEFPTGVAPDSEGELAQFRSKFYEASLKNGVATLDVDDEQLVSILLSVGFSFLGRVFTPRLAFAVNGTISKARTVSQREPFPPGATTTASKICLKLFVVRSIYPGSLIFYPQTFLWRYSETLRLLGAPDVSSLNQVVEDLNLFSRLSADERYFANGDGSEEELVTKTLIDRARELTTQIGTGEPIPSETLLRGVFIPLNTAWDALNAEDAPFERRGNSFLLLDSDGVPAASTFAVPAERRFFDPQPDLSSDAELKTLFAAYSDASAQDENGAPTSTFFHFNRLTGETIPHDVGFSEEIARIPSSIAASKVTASEERFISSGVPEKAPVASDENGASARNDDEHRGTSLPPESEALGELLDRLFRDGHTIVFYTTLFKRHSDVFERAGVESFQVKSALKEARPQYCYDNLFATPTKPSLAEIEIIRNALLLKWGDLRETSTANELAKRVYIPIVSIRGAIEGFPGVFYVGSDEKVALARELLERADRIFDNIVDKRKIGAFDVVFYSALYDRISEVFALHGIASATELRKTILDRGLEIHDFGEYMTFVADKTVSRDELVLNALRAVGLLLEVGWRVKRSNLRKNVKTLAMKFVDPHRETPPKIKVDRLYKSGSFYIPEEDVIRTLKAHPECFKLEPKGEWSLLNREGKPAAFWTEDELQSELDVFMGDVDRLRGDAEDPEDATDRTDEDRELEDVKENAGELENGDEIEEKEDETRDEETDGFVFNRTSLLSEPELESAAEDHDDLPSDSSEKYEEIGLLVDDLFRKSYGVLFYKVLFERHNELFKSLGIESPQAARDAIRAVRPQYDVQIRYVATEDSRGVESLELIRRDIERRLGETVSTTVRKLCETLYVPKADVQQTLEAYSSEFKRVGRDVYILEPQSSDVTQYSKSSSGFRPKDRKIKTNSYINGSKYKAVGVLHYRGIGVPAREESSPLKETKKDAKSQSSKEQIPENKPQTNAATVEQPPEPPAEPSPKATPRAATPKPEKSRVPVAPPPVPKQSPRERLREVVEELARSGQLVLYYHTLLERNAELAVEFGDKTALRAALVELFPSFGFSDSYFEPRRRSANESEEAKIRRSLILCWGDSPQRLDALALRFCAPAILIERTLKNSPDDFSDKGRQRFVLKDKARDEAARLKEYSARLLEDLKTLAPDGSYLFYEAYYASNAEWLVETGIDSVPLLRREFANLNKEAALGYVFYRNHCERVGSGLSESEFIRRLIQTRFGGESRLRVERLAEALRIPATLIHSALCASSEYVFEGGDSYRRDEETEENL